MANRSRPKRKTPSGARVALAQNVGFLLAHAQAHGKTIGPSANRITARLSEKTLYNLRHNLEQSPRLDVIETVAEAFGLEPWRLLMPGLTEEVLTDPGLARVMANYLRTPKDKRLYVEDLTRAYSKAG